MPWAPTIGQQPQKKRNPKPNQPRPNSQPQCRPHSQLLSQPHSTDPTANSSTDPTAHSSPDPTTYPNTLCSLLSSNSTQYSIPRVLRIIWVSIFQCSRDWTTPYGINLRSTKLATYTCENQPLDANDNFPDPACNGGKSQITFATTTGVYYRVRLLWRFSCLRQFCVESQARIIKTHVKHLLFVVCSYWWRFRRSCKQHGKQKLSSKY